MRTEDENVYRAFIALELFLLIICHLISILHRGFKTEVRLRSIVQPEMKGLDNLYDLNG